MFAKPLHAFLATFTNGIIRFGRYSCTFITNCVIPKLHCAVPFQILSTLLRIQHVQCNLHFSHFVTLLQLQYITDIRPLQGIFIFLISSPITIIFNNNWMKPGLWNENLNYGLMILTSIDDFDGFLLETISLFFPCFSPTGSGRFMTAFHFRKA